MGLVQQILNFASHLAQYLLAAFAEYQLLTLFVAVAVEEAGVPIPIPSDSLLMLAGAQNKRLTLEGIVLMLVAAFSAVLGSSILYVIMRRGGRPFLHKYGKYLLLNEDRLDWLDRKFQKYGRISLIVGRLIPGLRILVTVLAGLSGMPYPEFFVTVLIAALIWAGVYYGIGLVAGYGGGILFTALSDFLDFVPRWLIVVIALLLLAGIAVEIWHARRERREAERQQRPTEKPAASA
ncbi:MAG: hypothetical protein OJF49_003675 [Ktedonobacterales bacterium]|jgi:membrane protein DedA with SNARE-associated domain|nr:MAG: hypothetical protein OJF49_003675 [Ktedonobacterales bacterium]